MNYQVGRVKCWKHAGYYVAHMTKSKMLFELSIKLIQNRIYLRVYVYFQLQSQFTGDEGTLLTCTFYLIYHK